MGSASPRGCRRYLGGARTLAKEGMPASSIEEMTSMTSDVGGDRGRGVGQWLRRRGCWMAVSSACIGCGGRELG